MREERVLSPPQTRSPSPFLLSSSPLRVHSEFSGFCTEKKGVKCPPFSISSRLQKGKALLSKLRAGKAFNTWEQPPAWWGSEGDERLSLFTR